MARFRSEGATGFAEILDPEGPAWEHDTIRCNHCGAIVFTVPGTLSMQYLIYHPNSRTWTIEPGAFCRTCMHPVCLRCHRLNRGVCETLEARLVASEQADERRRWVRGLWRRLWGS